MGTIHFAAVFLFIQFADIKYGSPVCTGAGQPEELQHVGRHSAAPGRCIAARPAGVEVGVPRSVHPLVGRHGDPADLGTTEQWFRPKQIVAKSLKFPGD